MIRKLILTAVCGLFVCAPQGSCSRIAIEFTQAEKTFAGSVFAARAELSAMIRRIPLQIGNVPHATNRTVQPRTTSKAQTGGEQARRRAQVSDIEEQRPDQVPTLADAISKADECIRLCEDKMKWWWNRTMARKCGIPKTQAQASFLKKVLENIQKVQAGQELTPEEEEDFEAADCGYRVEVGPLVTAARQALLARSQQ